LVGLTSLKELHVENNKIKNIKPLTGLSKLEKVFMFKNSIDSKKCPFKLASVCIFEEEGAD
jgi:Leucine-rich repeat (LRR) protein